MWSGPRHCCKWMDQEAGCEHKVGHESWQRCMDILHEVEESVLAMLRLETILDNNDRFCSCYF